MDRKEREVRTKLMLNTRYRDLIELALPARMLWQCVYSITRAKDVEASEMTFCKETETLLVRAMYEPLNGMNKLTFCNVAVIIDKTSDWTLGIYQKRPVPTVFLIIFRWLQVMIESEYLVLYRGSNFDQAMDKIIAELEACPDLEAIDKSATKNSMKLLARLQTLGLYRDAEPFTLNLKSAS